MTNINVPADSALIVAFDEKGNVLGIYDAISDPVGNSFCPAGVANLHRLGKSGFVMSNPQAGGVGNDHDPSICYWVGDRMY